MEQFITLDKLVSLVLPILPAAQFEGDLEEQIAIYTNLTLGNTDKIFEIPEEPSV